MIEFEASREAVVLTLQLTMVVLALGVVAFVAREHWAGIRRFRERTASGLEPKRKAVEYTVRLDGLEAYVMDANAPAGKIVLGGWRVDARWADGDYLVIFRGKDGVNTRYRIDHLERHAGTGFYVAECTFAPRGAVSIERVRSMNSE